MSGAEISEVTLLLRSWSSGDKAALDRLVPLMYSELRRLAAGYIRREASGHTLQTTALVHEAYLRLVDQSRVEARDRGQFLAIAANLMRQILVNHAERRRALKRQGGTRVVLEEPVEISQPLIDVLALDQALTRLAQLDPQQGRIVELRCFGGLAVEEIARVLNISARTVHREWRAAKAALHHEFRHGGLS